ncbi:hypothetical protein Raf01_09330 [Rugosimonospora africana]|uniref:Uncharacterized protein n=1 Tax=Rugosimonospora africana TaxID=556532 RepID=A0A8J3VNX7_9ACTN|nr:hypothetical protein Raf01_09330 [Rugosimonospora africana]
MNAAHTPPTGCGGSAGTSADGVTGRPSTIHGIVTASRQEAPMAKKSRKKKARRKSAANHGKRPNS